MPHNQSLSRTPSATADVAGGLGGEAACREIAVGRQGAADLFVYGTLRIPEVMKAVTGVDFAGESAFLSGYGRFQLQGKPYPGVRVMADCVTDGLLYRGIDSDSLRRLDDYEDALYERTTVTVSVSRGPEVRAECYVIPTRHYGCLSSQPWHLERFRVEELAAYLERL